MSKKFKKERNIKELIITSGKNGAMLIDKNFKTYHCPAFASRTVDKIGSGDAMLSLISLGLKLKLDPKIILYLGSIAAAISVETIGNKKSIIFDDLDRSIEYMFK